MNRGFSLIELMVVCAVFGLLMLAAVPGLTMLVERGALKREAHELEQAIGSLLLAAQQNEATVSVELSATGYVAFLKNRPEVFLYSHNFKKPVALGSAQLLQLHKNGTASPATLTLVVKSESCLLKISLRGRTSLLC